MCAADLEVLFAGVGAPASGQEDEGDDGQLRAKGLEDLAAVEAALDKVRPWWTNWLGQARAVCLPGIVLVPSH